jgi:hypothetical protein
MSQMSPVRGREMRDRRASAVQVTSRGPVWAATSLTSLESLVRIALGIVLVVESALLLISLVPPTEWANLGQSPDGPIPHSLNWFVAGFFYVAPALIGALCRRWQVAVVLAALPAFLDLAIFAVAAASRLGPFYLAQDQHAPYTVGTLELFVALGALGWLARTALLLVLADRQQLPAPGARMDIRTDTK